MALQYGVRPKTILLCDYDLGGFKPPEMVKRRPAVVITGLLPGRDRLHTVVPLSGTPSPEGRRYHCRIELDAPLPEPFAETVWWAKCDMVATVGFFRLDLFQTKRDQYGRRKYLSDLRISDHGFAAIKQSLRHALSL